MMKKQHTPKGWWQPTMLINLMASYYKSNKLKKQSTNFSANIRCQLFFFTQLP